MVIDRRVTALKMPDTGKKIFKAKESSNALVEWILEINHRLRPFKMASPAIWPMISQRLHAPASAR